MSLAIDIDRIEAVLLADGWHRIAPRSFELDAYEYIQDRGHDPETGWADPLLRFGGGQSPLVPSTGFEFILTGDEGGFVVSGPITAILAVRHKR